MILIKQSDEENKIPIKKILINKIKQRKNYRMP